LLKQKASKNTTNLRANEALALSKRDFMSSQWGELEQRLEDRQLEIKENSRRAKITSNETTLDKLWKTKTVEISNLLEQGITQTEEWHIKNSNWVELKAGDFAGRSFLVAELITENRVIKYLSKHEIKISPPELALLMGTLSSLKAADAKNELKKYILKAKYSSYDRSKAKPQKYILVSEHNVKLKKKPRKHNAETKGNNGLFSKIFNYLFG